MKKIKNLTVKTIELAKQDRVQDLEKYIAILLKALGHPEALVTDESYVSDFMDIFSSAKQKEKKILTLRKKLGIYFNYQDFVVDVAEELKKKDNNEEAR